MDIKVYPGKLKGTVKVPPSKSMAHRALICASLAEGRSIVRGISDSKDMEATIGCMTALGAKIERTADRSVVVVDGICRGDGCGSGEAGSTESTEATAEAVEKHGVSALLNCIESGSTLRFVLPIAAALGADAAFEGRGKLPDRPMTPLADEMKKKGIEFLPDGRDSLPFQIRGQLQPGTYEIAGNISSQYFSGLIFALPLLDGDSEIRVKGKLESVGYIALTLKMVSDFGIQIEQTEYGFRIAGNQQYRPCEIEVEGDYSQAAFWFAAAACGSELTITGVREDSAQGDREALDIVERFGADVRRAFPDVVVRAPESGLASSTPEGCCGKKLTALEADGGDIPDAIPVLAVAASCAEGVSRFYNIGRLRIKECDRLAAMADCLTRLGVVTEEKQDELIITGGQMNGGCKVEGYNDHRIVMSMAVAALSCKEPVIITDAQAITKSYPDFFEEFRRLGGRADVISDR